MSPDQIFSCIVAGAIGDALGRPFEGRPRPKIISVPERIYISDDTQMSLATCEAIIESGRVEPELIADHFVLWFRARRITGIGSSTLKALRDLDFGAHWALSGAKGEKSAGNGAAMRVAPLAYMLDPANQQDRSKLRDICRITHHHDEAYLGGLAIVIAVRLASTMAYTIEDLVADVAEALPDSQVRDRLRLISEFPVDAEPIEVADRYGNSGFVVDSVPLALHAARAIRNQPLLNVLSSAILAGGDTDTVASMAGQIAGAYTGRSGLPDELFYRIHEHDEIVRIAERFSTIRAE